MDIALLRKAVDWVDEQTQLPKADREWYQGNWRALNEYLVEGDRCQTTFCVAGYLAEIGGGEWVQADPSHGHAHLLFATEGESGAFDMTEYARPVVTAWRRAANLLGIEEGQVDDMFGGNNDADDIRRMATYLARTYGEEL